MQITEIEMESGIRDANDYSHFRKPHRFERLVTHKVCDTCNRGWMSQLEIDFLDAVGQLIEPNWPTRDAELIREALRRSEVIARWAVKTAITANLAGVLRNRIPQEIAINLRNGKLPESLVVKVGHIRQRDFNFLMNPGFKFMDDGERWKVSESGKAFDAVFQLNHFAIRAINAPGVQLGFDASAGLRPLSVFPVVRDVPFTEYSFESFQDFEVRLYARLLTTQR